MSIARIETSDRLSQAVVYNGIAYIAGQVARDKPGASVAEQTRNILYRTDALLEKAGTDKSKLLAAQVARGKSVRAQKWISDIRYFDEMNAVWNAWLPPGEAPTRAFVESLLAAPHYFVEIACSAAVT